MSGSQATADPNMVAEPGSETMDLKLQGLTAQTEMAFKNLEEIINTATENKIQHLNENLQIKLTELESVV